MGNRKATRWAIYNAIRNVESSFRCLKNDPDLRAISHKTDETSIGHLHLGILIYWYIGILVYWTVNTLRYQLKAKAIQNEWTDIKSSMDIQKPMTTTMVDQFDQLIAIHLCS